MTKFKNWFTGACVALFCVASSLPLLAEDPAAITPGTPTVDNLVSPTSIQTTLLTSLQSWILVGVGIGISVLVAFLGWKWIRRFMGR
jgi:hypothetical protein